MPWPKEQKQRSRERIVKSAYALFAARGYDNVTIGDVMREAQLTHGAFYSHFDSKQALYAEAIVSEILKMPRRHAASLMLDHATRDWRDVIAQIRLPTLVVGARQSVFPAESQAWIAKQIPGARLEIFEADEGGSHFMCMENPARFNAIIREFLSA